jgi:hypothetical protein
VLQVKEDADAAQLEIDLRDSRSVVRSGFNEAAHQIEMYYDEVTQTYIAETLYKEIVEIDKQLKELREMQESQTKLFATLLDLQTETRNIIKKLHRSPDIRKVVNFSTFFVGKLNTFTHYSCQLFTYLYILIRFYSFERRG